MLRTLEDRKAATGGRDEEAHEVGSGFGSLRVLTAQLLLMTAADTVLGRLNGDARHRPLDYPGRGVDGQTAAGLAPFVIAPLAAAAHLAHVSRPSHITDVATRILDTAVVGIGIGSAIAGAVSRGGRGSGRLAAPLALATAGILGLAIDRHERIQARERRRLLRRASVVERLVPARRPRLDHVVVHV